MTPTTKTDRKPAADTTVPVQEPYRPMPGATSEEGNPQAFFSGEVGAGVYPDTTGQLGAMARLAGMHSPIGTLWETGAVTRGVSEWLLNREALDRGEDQLSAERANELFPGLEKPITGPMSLGAAAYRADTDRRKRRYQDWIARGPDHGTAATMGLGLVAGVTSLTDPAIIAGTYAFRVMMGAKSVTSALAVRPGAAAVLRSNLGKFGLDVAANAALEASVLPQLMEEEEVTASDLAFNIFGGALGFAALRGVGKGVKATGATAWMQGKIQRSWDGLSKAVKAKFIKKAIADHEAGRKVNTSVQAAEVQAMKAGAAASWVPGHVYREIKHPSEVPFFQAFDRPEGGVPAALFDSIADGQHAISDPNVANNLGNYIRRVDLPADAKFLDLRMGMDTAEGRMIADAFGLLPKEGETLSLFLQRVQQAKKQAIGPQFSQALKESGYVGVTDVVDTAAGPKNHVVLLDEPDPAIVDWFESTPAARPKLESQAKVQAAQEAVSDAMSVDKTPELENTKIVAKRSMADKDVPGVEEIDGLVENLDLQLKEAEGVNPGLVKDAEYTKAKAAIKSFDRERTLVDRAMQKLEDCFKWGIS